MSNNPYLLPDGNVQIAFSGGRTSGFMLHHILEANGGLPDWVVVSFQNTGREMPQTLDFVQECGQRWNVPIVWLEYQPESPRFKVVNHNSAARNGEPFEARRVKTQPLKERWQPWYPLFDAGISKNDVVSWWQKQPFDLRLPVVNGKSSLGNCDGCFLKSESTLAMLARDYPERFAWWERMEALAKENGWAGKNPVFNADRSYAGIRNFVEHQGDWIFNDEAFLCQKDEGECVI